MCERTRGLPTSAWPLTRRLGPAADRGARARAAPRRGARASRPSRSGVSRHDGVTTTELGVTTTELGAALARRGRARWPLPTMGDKWENAETGGAEKLRAEEPKRRVYSARAGLRALPTPNVFACSPLSRRWTAP